MEYICVKCKCKFTNSWNFKRHVEICDGRGKRGERKKVSMSEIISNKWKEKDYRDKQAKNANRFFILVSNTFR